VGSPASNQKLSSDRANTVRDYLISKGIDGSRIAAKGYGHTKPISENKTAEGRAENRRTEVTILD
jgi:outer membrane protein OmpA-like peptidoglycan-associated protein